VRRSTTIFIIIIIIIISECVPQVRVQCRGLSIRMVFILYLLFILIVLLMLLVILAFNIGLVLFLVNSWSVILLLI